MGIDENSDVNQATSRIINTLEGFIKSVNVDTKTYVKSVQDTLSSSIYALGQKIEQNNALKYQVDFKNSLADIQQNTSMLKTAMTLSNDFIKQSLMRVSKDLESSFSTLKSNFSNIEEVLKTIKNDEVKDDSEEIPTAQLYAMLERNSKILEELKQKDSSEEVLGIVRSLKEANDRLEQKISSREGSKEIEIFELLKNIQTDVNSLGEKISGRVTKEVSELSTSLQGQLEQQGEKIDTLVQTTTQAKPSLSEVIERTSFKGFTYMNYGATMPSLRYASFTEIDRNPYFGGTPGTRPEYMSQSAPEEYRHMQRQQADRLSYSGYHSMGMAMGLTAGMGLMGTASAGLFPSSAMGISQDMIQNQIAPILKTVLREEKNSGGAGDTKSEISHLLASIVQLLPVSRETQQIAQNTISQYSSALAMGTDAAKQTASSAQSVFNSNISMSSTREGDTYNLSRPINQGFQSVFNAGNTVANNYAQYMGMGQFQEIGAPQLPDFNVPAFSVPSVRPGSNLERAIGNVGDIVRPLESYTLPEDSPLRRITPRSLMRGRYSPLIARELMRSNLGFMALAATELSPLAADYIQQNRAQVPGINAIATAVEKHSEFLSSVGDNISYNMWRNPRYSQEREQGMTRGQKKARLDQISRIINSQYSTNAQEQSKEIQTRLKQFIRTNRLSQEELEEYMQQAERGYFNTNTTSSTSRTSTINILRQSAPGLHQEVERENNLMNYAGRMLKMALPQTPLVGMALTGAGLLTRIMNRSGLENLAAGADGTSIPERASDYISKGVERISKYALNTAEMEQAVKQVLNIEQYSREVFARYQKEVQVDKKDYKEFLTNITNFEYFWGSKAEVREEIESLGKQYNVAPQDIKAKAETMFKTYVEHIKTTLQQEQSRWENLEPTVIKPELYEKVINDPEHKEAFEKSLVKPASKEEFNRVIQEYKDNSFVVESDPTDHVPDSAPVVEELNERLEQLQNKIGEVQDTTKTTYERLTALSSVDKQDRREVLSELGKLRGEGGSVNTLYVLKTGLQANDPALQEALDRKQKIEILQGKLPDSVTKNPFVEKYVEEKVTTYEKNIQKEHIDPFMEKKLPKRTLGRPQLEKNLTMMEYSNLGYLDNDDKKPTQARFRQEYQKLLTLQQNLVEGRQTAANAEERKTLEKEYVEKLGEINPYVLSAFGLDKKPMQRVPILDKDIDPSKAVPREFLKMQTPDDKNLGREVAQSDPKNLADVEKLAQATQQRIAKTKEVESSQVLQSASIIFGEVKSVYESYQQQGFGTVPESISRLQNTLLKTLGTSTQNTSLTEEETTRYSQFSWTMRFLEAHINDSNPDNILTYYNNIQDPNTKELARVYIEKSRPDLKDKLDGAGEISPETKSLYEKLIKHYDEDEAPTSENFEALKHVIKLEKEKSDEELFSEVEKMPEEQKKVAYQYLESKGKSPERENRAVYTFEEKEAYRKAQKLDSTITKELNEKRGEVGFAAAAESLVNFVSDTTENIGSNIGTNVSQLVENVKKAAEGVGQGAQNLLQGLVKKITQATPSDKQKLVVTELSNQEKLTKESVLSLIGIQDDERFRVEAERLNINFMTESHIDAELKELGLPTEQATAFKTRYLKFFTNDKAKLITEVEENPQNHSLASILNKGLQRKDFEEMLPILEIKHPNSKLTKEVKLYLETNVSKEEVESAPSKKHTVEDYKKLMSDLDVHSLLETDIDNPILDKDRDQLRKGFSEYLEKQGNLKIEDKQQYRATLEKVFTNRPSEESKRYVKNLVRAINSNPNLDISGVEARTLEQVFKDESLNPVAKAKVSALLQKSSESTVSESSFKVGVGEQRVTISPSKIKELVNTRAANQTPLTVQKETPEANQTSQPPPENIYERASQSKSGFIAPQTKRQYEENLKKLSLSSSNNPAVADFKKITDKVTLATELTKAAQKGASGIKEFVALKKGQLQTLKQSLNGKTSPEEKYLQSRVDEALAAFDNFGAPGSDIGVKRSQMEKIVKGEALISYEKHESLFTDVDELKNKKFDEEFEKRNKDKILKGEQDLDVNTDEEEGDTPYIKARKREISRFKETDGSDSLMRLSAYHGGERVQAEILKEKKNKEKEDILGGFSGGGDDAYTNTLDSLLERGHITEAEKAKLMEIRGKTIGTYDSRFKEMSGTTIEDAFKSVDRKPIQSVLSSALNQEGITDFISRDSGSVNAMGTSEPLTSQSLSVQYKDISDKLNSILNIIAEDYSVEKTSDRKNDVLEALNNLQKSFLDMNSRAITKEEFKSIHDLLRYINDKIAQSRERQAPLSTERLFQPAGGN